MSPVHLLEVWDRSSLEAQEQTIGRHKYSGAPLGESEEFDPLDLDVKVDGKPTIPVNAHVRLASASTNGGERILCRGYSFTDGVDERLGELDAGLFFICFQRDPRRQFIAIQRRLGSSDALDEYIKHVGSAVFAVPPGPKRGATSAKRCSAERRGYSDFSSWFLLGCPNCRSGQPSKEPLSDEPNRRPPVADRSGNRPHRPPHRRLRQQRQQRQGSEDALLQAD